MNSAKDYATNLADDLTKITLTEFFVNVHAQFFKNKDISFMKYFLELTEHEDEFVVHHSKLKDYGVMTSDQSSDVGKKLKTLQLIEGEDYLLRDVSEQSETSRGVKYSKHYHLTPEAFKKCLMRAQRRANQPVDPVIYCDYYILLEKIYYLYTLYERLYSEKLLTLKDDKIDKQSAKIDKLQSTVESQSEEIRELLGYAKDTSKKLDEVQDDLTETKEEVFIAKTYLNEKSKTSTMNPADENKHHFFAATTFIRQGKQTVKFIAGQRLYVESTVDKNVVDNGHRVILRPFYNANGIDLRNNAKQEFLIRRRARLDEINAENATKDAIYNTKLKEEIKKYNKANPQNKRSFSIEKQKTPSVLIKDIPVNFNILSFTYTINPYIGFNEVLQVVIDVNGITQESPLQSDEEEVDEEEEDGCGEEYDDEE